MGRVLNSHKVNGCNDGITIEVQDQPGSGGANHAYLITGFDTRTNPSRVAPPAGDEPTTAPTDVLLLFQNGPIAEAGTNGITHENLLAILIDRLEGFQSGKFATVENQIALDHLRAAQAMLKFRTEQRLRRGVEGTHKV